MHNLSMSASIASRALLQFVDDELLRAPLIFDQVADATLEQLQQSLAGMSAAQRSATADLMQALKARKIQIAEHFVRSLRQQVAAELGQQPPPGEKKADASTPLSLSLSLVDEDAVAIDVELAHAIETIKSTAEYELRELQTFTSALVGDMAMARDHNPFRAESYAHALWAAAQALPLSRGHHVALLRHASLPLARVLRQSYAASASRLESQGVEPAAYRTVILVAGSRRERPSETTFSPDLQRMRESMLGELDPPPPAAGGPSTTSSVDARGVAGRGQAAVAPLTRADRQAHELVTRLFAAIRDDERVPPDVLALILQLQGPALRLVVRDPSLLEQDTHPLWMFVNRLAYEAEMAPDTADPERGRLLKLGQGTVQQLANEPVQNSGLYHWAAERLDTFLKQRLARRCAAAASQIGAMQKLEDKLVAGQTTPSGLGGALDVPHLDTVPSDLIPEAQPGTPPPPDDDAWLDELRPGEWVRMFLQGRWIHAQVLWPGERREIWLFGDGASDATWAVRRRALHTLREQRLLKMLARRSLVRRAARQVHDDVAEGA